MFVPSMWSRRRFPGTSSIPVGSYPTPPTNYTAPDSTTQLAILTKTLNALNSVFTRNADPSTLSSLLDPSSVWWRDYLCLDWRLKTLTGAAEIIDVVQRSLSGDAGTTIINFKLYEQSGGLPPTSNESNDNSINPRMSFLDPARSVPCLEAVIDVETTVGKGRGLVRLVRGVDRIGEGGVDAWYIITLYTALDDLSGHEAMVYERRPRFARPRDLFEVDEIGKLISPEPNVLIVGAGHSGITIAANLRALQISALVIDVNPCVGDSWRTRYSSLMLHSPLDTNSLPWMDYPPTFPTFPSKDQIADMIECYAKIMEVNVWNETRYMSGTWDDKNHMWTVVVNRKINGIGIDVTIHPKHLIQATGFYGPPYSPPTMLSTVSTFLSSSESHRVYHSSDYRGAATTTDAGHPRRVVIIGASTAAHNIAIDCVSNGDSVTMIQRGGISIISARTVCSLYVQQASHPPFDDVHLLNSAMPFPILKRIMQDVWQFSKSLDSELLARYTALGFELDDGPDSAGWLFAGLETAGNFYIAELNGAVDALEDGRIRLVRGEVLGLSQEGVRVRGVKNDEEELVIADEIIFATGYNAIQVSTAEIFGQEIADRVGLVNGVDEESLELKAIWGITNQPGFYIAAGNLMITAAQSKWLALVIKATDTGLVKA